MLIVIEDDPGILAMLGDLFSGEGFPFLGISRAHSACLTFRHCPSVMLLDLMLSGNQDGVEIAHAFKERGLTCPIIAMSASPHMLQNASDSGLFAACVAKPFDACDLVQLVRQFHG